MKTGSKIALLIGILLLAFGLTVMQIARHRGESFSVGLSFGGETPEYDQKGFRVLRDGEERFAPGELDTLKIDWLSGSVSVESYAGGEIVVREKAASALTEEQSLRFRLSGGTLSILPCANRVRKLPVKDLTVLVPEGVTLTSVQADTSSASVALRALELRESAELESVSGSLRVEDCRCFKLELSSASGSQEVRRCEVKNALEASGVSGSFTAEEIDSLFLEVESSSGSQRIETANCDTLQLSSISGSQRVSGLDCRTAKATSTSGSVRLSFDREPASVDVETSSGSVELSFPEGTGIDLDFDRRSGSLHGEVLRGPIPVNVETVSGGLTILYR